MDGGAWRDTVHGATKESEITERLNNDNKCLSGSLEPRTNNTGEAMPATSRNGHGDIHTWVVEG